MGFRIEALSAGYPRHPVLRDVTLAPVPEGRLLALLGPNGAGKSTLLRAIAGLVPATGRVWLDGTDLLALPPRGRARLMGFVPQALPPGRIAQRAGGHRGGAAHRAAGDRRGRGRAAGAGGAGPAGGAGLALEPIGRLSGGQRQIAGLAPAVAADPPLLLLDEPSSALDLAHQFRLMRLLQDIAREGRRVVVVLHDLTLAAQWADEIAVLHDGRLVAQGPPGAVVTAGLLRDVWRVRASVSGDPPRIAIHDLAEGAVR